jgi:spore coat protein U-like protein
MRKTSAVAIFLFSLYSANALAGTASTTMTVTAIVGNACSVMANNLSFGRFEPLKPISPSNGQAQTNIFVTCLSGTDYNIYLSAGNSADFTSRYMNSTSGSSSKVRYNLYTDASLVNIWGDQTQTYDGGIGTGLTQDYVVYGQIADGQASMISPGNYMDTIQIDISY